MENDQNTPRAEHDKLIYKRVRLMPLLPPDTWEKYFQSEENAVAFIEEGDMSQWPPALQGLREWIEQNILPPLWAELED